MAYFELVEEIEFKDTSKKFVDSVIRAVKDNICNGELKLVKLVPASLDAKTYSLEVHRKQYFCEDTDKEDRNNLLSTEVAKSVLDFISVEFQEY